MAGGLDDGLETAGWLAENGAAAAGAVEIGLEGVNFLAAAYLGSNFRVTGVVGVGVTAGVTFLDFEVFCSDAVSFCFLAGGLVVSGLDLFSGLVSLGFLAF